MKLNKILACVGILLIIVAVVMVAVSRISINSNIQNAKEIVDSLKSLMPETTTGVKDERVNAAMACIEIKETDFSGILEIPQFETILPICNSWDKDEVDKYPHRYYGSVYDGSMVIGGSDNKGQMDFIKEIDMGALIYITDTLGARFTYEVQWVEHTKDVSTSNLCSDEYDLTLFARNTYGFEYTLIRCNSK